MKLTTSQSDLATHLGIVARAVSSRPSRPVLANILVKADIESQAVTLVGFDEVLGIETRFSAQVDESGTLTLPAKLWGDIVSRLANEELILEAEGDSTTVTITSSSGRYEVRGLNAEYYPSLPTVEGTPFALAGDALLAGLHGCLFATSGDETKQVLTGVHLLSESDSLEFAATDGHRLAVVKGRDETPYIPSVDVTIPAKALRELERMVGAGAVAEVQLTVDETQVYFDLGAQRLTTRLLEGQYPNYRQLLPKSFARQVTVDRRLLMLSLERIAVLASQKNDIIKIAVDSTAQAISLSVEATEVGSAREDMPARVTGDDLNIAFNVRFLLDGLRVMGSSEVTMHCNAPTSPVVFKPVEGGLRYLVMPCQIRS